MTSPINFDAWLAGAARTTHSVTLYGRHDLQGRIDELDRLIASAEKASIIDQAAGDDAPSAPLRAEREELLTQIIDSRIVLRVEASIEDEVEAASKAARNDLQEQTKAAAGEARAVAERDTSLSGLKGEERQRVIFAMSSGAIDKVIASEQVIRVLSERVQVPAGEGEWEPIGRERLIGLRNAIGDAQFRLVRDAWERATRAVPEVNVPFSPER